LRLRLRLRLPHRYVTPRLCLRLRTHTHAFYTHRVYGLLHTRTTLPRSRTPHAVTFCILVGYVTVTVYYVGYTHVRGYTLRCGWILHTRLFYVTPGLRYVVTLLRLPHVYTHVYRAHTCVAARFGFTGSFWFTRFTVYVLPLHSHGYTRFTVYVGLPRLRLRTFFATFYVCHGCHAFAVDFTVHTPVAVGCRTRLRLIYVYHIHGLHTRTFGYHTVSRLRLRLRTAFVLPLRFAFTVPDFTLRLVVYHTVPFTTLRVYGLVPLPDYICVTFTVTLRLCTTLPRFPHHPVTGWFPHTHGYRTVWLRLHVGYGYYTFGYFTFVTFGSGFTPVNDFTRLHTRYAHTALLPVCGYVLRLRLVTLRSFTFVTTLRYAVAVDLRLLRLVTYVYVVARSHVSRTPCALVYYTFGYVPRAVYLLRLFTLHRTPHITGWLLRLILRMRLHVATFTLDYRLRFAHTHTTRFTFTFTRSTYITTARLFYVYGCVPTRITLYVTHVYTPPVGYLPALDWLFGYAPVAHCHVVTVTHVYVATVYGCCLRLRSGYCVTQLRLGWCVPRFYGWLRLPVAVYVTVTALRFHTLLLHHTHVCCGYSLRLRYRLGWLLRYVYVWFCGHTRLHAVCVTHAVTVVTHLHLRFTCLPPRLGYGLRLPFGLLLHVYLFTTCRYVPPFPVLPRTVRLRLVPLFHIYRYARYTFLRVGFGYIYHTHGSRTVYVLPFVYVAFHCGYVCVYTFTRIAVTRSSFYRTRYRYGYGHTVTVTVWLRLITVTFTHTRCSVYFTRTTHILRTVLDVGYGYAFRARSVLHTPFGYTVIYAHHVTHGWFQLVATLPFYGYGLVVLRARYTLVGCVYAVGYVTAFYVLLHAFTTFVVTRLFTVQLRLRFTLPRTRFTHALPVPLRTCRFTLRTFAVYVRLVTRILRVHRLQFYRTRFICTLRFTHTPHAVAHYVRLRLVAHTRRTVTVRCTCRLRARTVTFVPLRYHRFVTPLRFCCGLVGYVPPHHRFTHRGYCYGYYCLPVVVTYVTTGLRTVYGCLRLFTARLYRTRYHCLRLVLRCAFTAVGCSVDFGCSFTFHGYWLLVCGSVAVPYSCGCTHTRYRVHAFTVYTRLPRFCRGFTGLVTFWLRLRLPPTVRFCTVAYTGTVTRSVPLPTQLVCVHVAFTVYAWLHRTFILPVGYGYHTRLDCGYVTVGLRILHRLHCVTHTRCTHTRYTRGCYTTPHHYRTVYISACRGCYTRYGWFTARTTYGYHAFGLPLVGYGYARTVGYCVLQFPVLRFCGCGSFTFTHTYHVAVAGCYSLRLHCRLHVRFTTPAHRVYTRFRTHTFTGSRTYHTFGFPVLLLLHTLPFGSRVTLRFTLPRGLRSRCRGCRFYAFPVWLRFWLHTHTLRLHTVRSRLFLPVPTVGYATHTFAFYAFGCHWFAFCTLPRTRFVLRSVGSHCGLVTQVGWLHTHLPFCRTRTVCGWLYVYRILRCYTFTAVLRFHTPVYTHALIYGLHTFRLRYPRSTPHTFDLRCYGCLRLRGLRLHTVTDFTLRYVYGWILDVSRSFTRVRYVYVTLLRFTRLLHTLLFTRCTHGYTRFTLRLHLIRCRTPPV